MYDLWVSNYHIVILLLNTIIPPVPLPLLPPAPSPLVVVLAVLGDVVLVGDVLVPAAVPAVPGDVALVCGCCDVLLLAEVLAVPGDVDLVGDVLVVVAVLAVLGDVALVVDGW